MSKCLYRKAAHPVCKCEEIFEGRMYFSVFGEQVLHTGVLGLKCDEGQ